MSLSPTTSIFDRDLPRGPANHSVLTPLDFLDRAATVYPDKPAVVHGTLQRSYAETYARCRRLASALKRRGIGVGDTVSVMLPNRSEERRGGEVCGRPVRSRWSTYLVKKYRDTNNKT